MSVYRLIPSKWCKGLYPKEGHFSFEELLKFNEVGYNIYFYPNYPSISSYSKIPINPNSRIGSKQFVTGAYIDTFEYIFCDMDMKNYHDGTSKSHDYASPDIFIESLATVELLPTRIIHSGNGIHAYWKVSDLDARSFLRLNRRLARFLNTDVAVCNLEQLMRVPNTLNTKDQDNFKLCELLFEEEQNIYDCETLDKWLPPINVEDETYCEQHYNMAYDLEDRTISISEELPNKFLKLCKENKEAHSLFYNTHKDRSSADFRLGHLMHANSLTADEAKSVLMQTCKASERTKQHRYNYACNIVDKIWTVVAETNKDALGSSVTDILSRNVDNTQQGVRFKCHELIDATEHGFRLGHVFGLVGGEGNGKTTISLNFFKWFVERNPDYVHMYISLEMPKNEIAYRWQKLCGDNKNLNDKVFIIDNYREDGSFRDLSLIEIQQYILEFQKTSGKKVGAVVIDHIGILRQEKGGGEFDGLIGICKRLKSFAIATQTFLIIQSQTSRALNGMGDVELDASCAYGTSAFEWYVDWLMTTHQPLKRVYDKAPHACVNAFKYAKIRHKDILKDRIKQGVVYAMMFEPGTGGLRAMTSDEMKIYLYWSPIATQLRNADRRKEPSELVTTSWVV